MANDSGNLTKYQKFEAVRVWRHELVPHPKNPRQIAPEARRKLKKNIKSGGRNSGLSGS